LDHCNPALHWAVAAAEQFIRQCPLCLMGLKKRLGGVPRLRQKASSPAFVELIAPKAVTLKECVIEIHKGGLVLPGLFAVAGGVMLIEERNTSERSVRFYFCSESVSLD
jgi:hypothetical protein